MRAICLSIAILSAVSTTAIAQNYRLEFHSDEALTSCELAVTSPGLIKVHMVVTGQGGPLAGVNFKALKPPCMRSAVWFADVWQQPTIRATAGNTQAVNGVDAILDCNPPPPNFLRYLPVYLGWIWFSVTEPTDPCCVYGPGPTPLQTTPTIWMCTDFFAMPMATRALVMNPNNSCRCDGPVATHQTTWGAVKALYAD